METAWFVLIAFTAGWIVATSSGALFAYIVFKTKREPHENLFALGKPRGDAFIVDDLQDSGPVPRPGRMFMPEEKDMASTILDDQTDRFLKQFQTAKKIMAEKEKEAAL